MQRTEYVVLFRELAGICGSFQSGRTTVETLQLNREGVFNLRRVLYGMAEHPPLTRIDKI